MTWMGTSKKIRYRLKPSKWHRYKPKAANNKRSQERKILISNTGGTQKQPAPSTSDDSTSEQFKEKLTLDSVMAMDEDELRTSPISSRPSSLSSDSSAWETIDESES